MHRTWSSLRSEPTTKLGLNKWQLASTSRRTTKQVVRHVAFRILFQAPHKQQVKHEQLHATGVLLHGWSTHSTLRRGTEGASLERGKLGKRLHTLPLPSQCNLDKRPRLRNLALLLPNHPCSQPDNRSFNHPKACWQTLQKTGSANLKANAKASRVLTRPKKYAFLSNKQHLCANWTAQGH